MRWTAAIAALVALAGCRDEGPQSSRGDAARPALSRPDQGRAHTGGAPGEPAALPDAVREVRGTVARASERELVVQPEQGEPVALAIVPGIPITVDGRVSAAERIPEGADVRASYVFEEGEPRAMRVQVRSGAR